jgi:hypothetical protein
MTSNGRSESPSRRLDSWTEIAEYLGRSSRTVQRWHTDYHLPIHRLGGSKGSLFAYTNELDTWMWSRGQEESAQKISSHRPVLVHAAPAHTEAAPLSDEGAHSDSHGITKDRSADLVGVAQRLWETLSHTNIETMARLFRQAIDLDPSNADAYAGLALAFIVEGLLDDLPMRSATASAQAALTRALEMTSESGERSASAKTRCPRCNGHMRRVYRSGVFETTVFPKFGYYPWECPNCETRKLFRARGRREHEHHRVHV